MRRLQWTITGLVVALITSPSLVGQVPGIREQLVARGAPTEFADRVASIVAAAEANDLPTEPLVSKALEGWAKRGRVPPDRVVTVLSQLSERLSQGREVVISSGLDPAPGSVVAAAAEAIGRGMTPEDVRSVIDAAPAAPEAATGLTVASSLAAQGLERAAAVKVVGDAYRGGRAPEEILEFPSAVAGLKARGERMSDVARRILQGGGLPTPGGQGGQGMGPQRGRPPGVPASKDPPGKAQKKKP